MKRPLPPPLLLKWLPPLLPLLPRLLKPHLLLLWNLPRRLRLWLPRRLKLRRLPLLKIRRLL